LLSRRCPAAAATAAVAARCVANINGSKTEAYASPDETLRRRSGSGPLAASVANWQKLSARSTKKFGNFLSKI
jgi:hypothetical protein